MSVIRIHKGRDIRLKGAAEKKVEKLPLPSAAALQPPDFRGLRPRLLVKEGDLVKVGTPLFEDKTLSEIKVVSPVSGKVAAINRGAKRALQEIVVQSDGLQDVSQLRKIPHETFATLSRKDIIHYLLEGGIWPCLRQRPFSNVADPHDTPKSIFVQAMNTEPLALDVNVVMENQDEEFRLGLELLSKLTDGLIHVCCAEGSTASALTQLSLGEKVHFHHFAGPHPAGNVGTHIHYIDPIGRGDIVWYIYVEDVLRITRLFQKGHFAPERTVAVTGEGAARRNYYTTIIGASLTSLLKDSSLDGQRCISGSVLRGRNVGAQGFLCFYDSQVTVFPEGGKRELLGWMMPGFNKYTFSWTFMSAFGTDSGNASLDADENGGHRAIVLNHVYDSYVALDVMTYFLLRAVIAGDIEEAERLGILECDEEDFSLCAFACPSKTDVGGIIREGLELIEKEG